MSFVIIISKYSGRKSGTSHKEEVFGGEKRKIFYPIPLSHKPKEKEGAWMTSKTKGEVSLGILGGHSPIPYVFWGFCGSTCLVYMWYNAGNLLRLRKKKI